MKRKPDVGPDVCELDLIKHRDGATGNLGLYEHNWLTARFFPHVAKPKE